METPARKWLKVSVRCPFCGEQSIVTVDASDWERFSKPGGPLVREAFPYLTSDERELLISGTCVSCWNKYMKCVNSL